MDGACPRGASSMVVWKLVERPTLRGGQCSIPRKGESEPPHGQCSIPRKGSAGESEPPHVYGKTSRWNIVRNPIYILLIDSGRRVLGPSMVGFTISQYLM